MVFADETLENVSTDPVTIDEVRLVEPDGLTLRESFLLPIVNRTLMGTGALPPSVPVWAERQQAIGADLAPGETWNLALVLDRGKHPGRFVDVEVAFTADGDSATHRVGWALTIVAAPPC